MTGTVGSRPGRIATPNAKKPAASSSARRSKKTNSSGTTAPGQLAVSLSACTCNTTSTLVGTPRAKKTPAAKYFSWESKRMIARAFGLLNERVRSKTHDEARSEKGYQLIAYGVSLEGMNAASCAWNNHRSDDERGRRSRGKLLNVLLVAASRPPLHSNLDVKLYTSQDGSVGVPSLGGVESMSFYTRDGAPVTDPARLQELEAESQVAASAVAVAASAAVAAAPAVAPSTPGNDDVREAMRVCLMSSTNANKAVEATSNAVATVSGAVTELTTEFRAHRAQSNARHEQSKTRHEQSEARLGKIEDELELVRSGKKSSESGHGYADLVPPSTDKKPSARPSPKRLFVTAGGTGSDADVGGSFGAHNSVVANASVLKATPVTDRAVPSISFADTSAAPLEDLEKWQFEGLAEGNTVQPTLVKRLLQQYVRDESINGTLRRGNATRQDENFVNSISIALTAIKPFPFVKCCVYRGIELTHEDAFRFKALMSSGEPFVEPGLLSASAKSLDELQNKTYVQRNTYFAIQSKSGRLIQKYSKREDEWEVLFAAGTSFRILSFEDTTPVVDPGVSGWGRYKIVMEEVESKIWGL